MKLDKILGKTATILEVIALFILIFKAKSMIVTTAKVNVFYENTE